MLCLCLKVKKVAMMEDAFSLQRIESYVSAKSFQRLKLPSL